MLQLKHYQERCLEVLRDYLRRAREVGAESAYNESQTRPRDHWDRFSNYAAIRNWPQSAAFPYVCLRVPTGGGKTVIAAHAVGIATRSFLQTDRAVVLWLAPSNTIVDQTLKCLRDRRHAYRAALDEAFKGCVTVLSVEEALSVKPGTLNADTTIIVATMQTFRVTEKSDRRVYKSNGELLDHFANLDDKQLSLLEKTDADGNVVQEGGVIARSLANVLRLRMPLVIVDEAHNARSDLSFETLERFNPSAILEFTATPAPHTKNKIGSNVLFSVSAAELKAAHMIKMPIRLVERRNPHEAISAAIAKREELERLAAEEEKTSGEYIRPIVLFQAESRREGEERVTADVLRGWLVKDFGDIKPEEIAIRTGEKDELPDEPLARDCKLKYVITVSALREGWDCPFAYVLCSVANLSASGAVEQILGRVMRLPYARKKNTEELNQAYAYPTSTGFGMAAKSLKDSLVEIGFERYEAEAMVADEGADGRSAGGDLPLFGEPIAEVVSAALPPAALAALPKAVREKVTFGKRADTGETEIVYTGGPLAEAHASALAGCFDSKEDQRAVEKIKRRTRGQGTSPSEMGDRLAVPQLAVQDPDSSRGWTLFDPQDCEITWTLADCDAQLGPVDLDPARNVASGADLDVDAQGAIRIQYLTQLQEQMQLRDLLGPKTPERFVEWLDGEVSVREATQAEKRQYLERVLAYLIAQRGLSMETLLPLRWRLVAAIESLIDGHRLHAQHATYQAMLSPDYAQPVQCRPEVAFEFPCRLGVYPAPSIYTGEVVLKRHFYDNIGAMNPEEVRCAALIDAHPNTAYWVRNLTAGAFAFRLPLADRGFYPDFVAKLKDGRIAVVEYKGEGGLDRKDTEEKDLIGRMWANRSSGRCVFELVGKDDMQARLERALAPIKA